MTALLETLGALGILASIAVRLGDLPQRAARDIERRVAHWLRQRATSRGH